MLAKRPLQSPLLDAVIGRRVAMGVCCALAVGQIGCQSRSSRDLHVQKMASEIRVLEDQLYDADYQNRVLRDKLERSRAIPAPYQPSYTDSHMMAPYGQAYEPPSVLNSHDDDDARIDTGGMIDSRDVAPEAVPTPDSDAAISIEDLELPSQLPDEPTPKPSKKLPPAPGGPEPPGADDLELPDIDAGDIMPPPLNGEAAVPPGRVELPESLQPKSEPISPPSKLAIHPGLSGGHQFDEGDSDGLYVVVNALDDRGRMVDLSAFDIDASMTVVALDPKLPSSEARIGRWEFDAEQVARFVRSDPVSGLHVPVRWQETEPLGEDVIVHVRLRAGADEMTCDAQLRVEPAAATATWTPRAQSVKR